MEVAANKTARHRILILCKYFSYGHGGTPEAVLLLARGLEQIGISVDVRAHDRLVPDAGKLDDLPPQCVEQKMQPDIRIADYCGLVIAGAWIFEALRFAVLARRARIPLIYQTKGQLCKIEFTRLRDLRRLLYLAMVEIWVALLSTRILFTSQLEKENSLLPRFLKRQKGHILPEPLDPARLGLAKRSTPKDGQPLRLGFIAQISPRKGLREFVAGYLAWKLANPDYPIELTIAGTAVSASEKYLSNIQSLIAEHPGKAAISFTGQISGPDRANFYGDTDVLVVPSHFESFCLAVPEALWSGCAILASPRLGVLEFLEHHPAIKVIADVSPDAIGKALDELIWAWPDRREGVLDRQSIAALDPTEIAKGTWSLIENADR